MSDDRYKSEEQRAKEEAYREYLRLREESGRGGQKGGVQGSSRNGLGSPERRSPSVTGTPYGSSELRRRAKEKEADRQAYLKARAEIEEEERTYRESRAAKKAAKAARKASRKEDSPYTKPAKKKNRKLRIALIVLIVLILGVGGVAAGALGMAMNTLNKIGHVKIHKDEIAISSEAKSNLKDFTNIAVLGVDARDVENDKDSRSDAIVVLSINKKTNEVKMFSVFRDTLMDLGGDVGLDKVTHAYFYGGAQNTLYALNKNMDLNIKKVVVINWKTVAEIIDALGGIKIEIQDSEIEEMNKYIPGTAKTTGSKAKLIQQAGEQKLNGAQAVTYARIRKDAASGDYRRNERMKIVMAQTFKKARKADLKTLKKICDNAFPQAKTNLSSREMISMALKFRKYEMTSTTTGWPYDVAGWMGYAGAGYAWYGPPVTLASNVTKLYDKFFGISDYEPSETVQTISQSISELTGLY